MKILKRPNSDIQKEEAHGGSGARKVWASPEYLKSTHFEVIGTFVEVLGFQFDRKDTIQQAVFGAPRSSLDVA